MTDVNITTPASIAETDALIASLNEPAAPAQESLEQKVARLEAQIAEVRQGNIAKPIENPDGTSTTYKDLRTEHQKFLDEMALSTESSRVFREEVERRSHLSQYGQTPWQPAGYAERPLLTEDEAVKEFGLSKWAALTPQQRAQAKTVTQAMVDRVDLPSVFGRTSTGAKAMKLSSENPALYRMAKRKAREDGLI
jgi:hypothetical protein